MRNKLFAPGDLTALVGDPITWRNDDTVAHDVAAYDGSLDSGPHRAGRQRAARLHGAGAGPRPYRCTLHRFMIAPAQGGRASRCRPAPRRARARPVTLTGRAPAGTGEVTFERRLPDGTFAAVAAARPAADGTFSAEVAPRAPSSFRARAGELTSADLRLAVARG